MVVKVNKALRSCVPTVHSSIKPSSPVIGGTTSTALRPSRFISLYNFPFAFESSSTVCEKNYLPSPFESLFDLTLIVKKYSEIDFSRSLEKVVLVRRKMVHTSVFLG